MTHTIRCGHCKQTHATVDEVWQCAYWEQEQEADMLAELKAERRNERFWEERGRDDGFDEWEARMGLLSYEAARDLAEGR